MRIIFAIIMLTGCTSSAPRKSTDASPPCDPTPGTLGGMCLNVAAGQCVDFANLGSSDLASVQAGCTGRGGSWGAGPCGTVNRIGSCQIPPADPNTDVSCSPNATILLRYFPPRYDLAKAMAACAGAPGTTFTPN